MSTLSADDFAAIFAQSLEIVVHKISGFNVHEIQNTHQERSDNMIAMLLLPGQHHKMLFISACEHTMRTLCAYMIGSAPEDFTRDELEDALCEIANMTAGNAKLMLMNDYDNMFSITSPITIRGEALSVNTKKRVPILTRTVGCDGISIHIRIIRI